MAIVVASCLVPLRDQHSQASSFETACRKPEGGILSRTSYVSLRPENSSQFLSLSPVFGRAAVSLSACLSSANSLVGISRSLSNLDSPRRLSFSSSPFLNFLAFSMASRTRKTVGKSTAESPGVFRSSLLTKEEEKVVEETIVPEEEGGNGGNNSGGGEGGGGGGGGGDGVGWISSALVFGFWAGLILYGATISPNQTQYQDVYFIEKLLNLHADDGFVMNKVLVAEWWFMGFWPLLYTCLLIPSGRSRKGGVMVGPFLVGSFFIGAFSLLPYFGLWRPPPPVVSKDDRSRFPLVILESKITAVVAIVAGLVLAWYAGSAGGDQWTEFIQYVLESRFIHIMTIDFLTLSTLAPFWVYNDLSYRRRSGNISWLLLLTLIPYLGTALYVFLRPPLLSSTTSDESEEISDTREAS